MLNVRFDDDGTHWAYRTCLLYTSVSGPVSMVWEAAEGTMLGFLPVTSIPNIAEDFGSIALVQVLQSVTFQEDGQIVASISKAGVELRKPVTPVWETSEPGYASYNVTDKQILVFLDITKIMGSLKSKAAIDPLEQIMALLQNGIPVNYEIASDGKSAPVSYTHLDVYKRQPCCRTAWPTLE